MTDTQDPHALHKREKADRATTELKGELSPERQEAADAARKVPPSQPFPWQIIFILTHHLCSTSSVVVLLGSCRPTDTDMAVLRSLALQYERSL